MLLEKAKRETVPAKPRNTDTITFSLPPEMARELRQVVREEREWRRRERLQRLRSRQNDQE